ncbi:MAG: hypothetical protein KUF80_18005, partial [Candidatus Thiodiazotropha sp. (ex Codakia orbicularis)]|nr:hypothetical protein [Candidatus Thiodiazotropha sp. (ex Codakia orbicularis)]
AVSPDVVRVIYTNRVQSVFEIIGLRAETKKISSQFEKPCRWIKWQVSWAPPNRAPHRWP